MNRPNRQALIAILIIAAIASRIVPHPPNFTAVGAIGLFGGASLASRRLAFALPMVVMMISDWFIGFHWMMLVIYPAMLAYVWIGRHVGSHLHATRIISGSLLGSSVFFIVTNLSCWWGGYEHSLVGLTTCFVAAIPFFGGTLAGDLVYSGALFGALAMAESRMPTLRPSRSALPRLQNEV